MLFAGLFWLTSCSQRKIQTAVITYTETHVGGKASTGSFDVGSDGTFSFTNNTWDGEESFKETVKPINTYTNWWGLNKLWGTQVDGDVANHKASEETTRQLSDNSTKEAVKQIDADVAIKQMEFAE